MALFYYKAMMGAVTVVTADVDNDPSLQLSLDEE